MKKLTWAACIILLSAILLQIPFFIRFTITDGKTNRIAWMEPVDAEALFFISFKHSVNRTPVNEYYRISHHKFVAYKTTFYSYGAGMPELAPGGREKISISQDGLVQIDDMDRVMDHFTVFIGTYADHYFHYKDKEMRLALLIEPQRPAVFEIKRVSILQILTWKGLH